LYGYRSNHAYEIASLTKIMTFYVIMGLVQENSIDIKK
jgi:D-alanyl-D-alanine carboxypeptidase